MPENAITLTNIHKTFGRRSYAVDAVRDISLSVAPGQVYGFLGPNGAGKSTTIRMIMSLIRPSQGHIAVFGRSIADDKLVLRRVGALVEGAAFYPFLTGRQNLQVLARTAGRLDAARIAQLLHFVGLAQRGDRQVKGFSTGMKQRLGLAAALLTDPDLVILDEPTNGLDPAGIQEMRTIIRNLVDQQGKTVFLSSHMLNEVEQVCDRVAIIDQGQIIHEGTVDDLLAGQHQVLLELAPLAAAQALLADRWACLAENGRLRVDLPREDVPQLVRLLADNGVDLYQMQVARQSLEAFFLKVTAVAQEASS